MQENILYLLWEPYETHKYIVPKDKTVLML